MGSNPQHNRIQAVIDALERIREDFPSDARTRSFAPDDLDLLSQAVNRLARRAGCVSPPPGNGVEARLQKVLHRMQESYFEADLKGNIQFFNDRLPAKLGYDASEIRGMNFRDLVDERNRKIVYETFHSLFLTGAPVRNFEWQLLRKDGQSMDVESSVDLLCDEKGRPTGFCGVTRDITPRKTVEKELGASEERYRHILDSIEESYFEVDLHGNLLFFNDTVLRDLNYTPAEIRNVNFRRLVDDANAAKVFAAFHQVYVTGKPVKGFDWVIQRKDGSGIEVESSAALIRDEVGRPRGFRGIVRDISQRKTMEEALRQSEERYRMIVENMQDTISVIDINTLSYLYQSPSEIRVTGYTPEEIMQIPLERQVTPESYARAVAILAEELQRESDGNSVDPHRSRVFEMEVYHKNGSTVWLEVTASFQRDKTGKPVGILMAGKNIAERKKAEAEREKLERQLLQSQKLETIGRLAGGVAHDFNNMLNVILGYVDLIKLKLKTRRTVLHDIQEIEKAACRSRDLTAQLLAFSRKQMIQPQIVNLNRLIGDMEKTIRRLIGEDIALHFFPDAGLWPVKVDPTQVEQILINLSVNARDAMTPGGKLTLETSNIVIDRTYSLPHPDSSPGPYVRLEVSDTGAGIAPGDLPLIFEPFFTTKEIGKGTGLGLSTVYGIVKQNNGFITVYSEPARGSVFKVYLPRCLDEAPGKESAAKTDAPAGSGTILLVEDDAMLLKMISEMLETMGYDVIRSQNPHELLSRVEKKIGSIDLAITDVVMPGLSGRELRDRLLAENPNLKVLFMSGYTANIIALHGILEDGVQFIQKPFTMSDLAAKVSELIPQTKQYR
ncbi:MAG: PAS domain S-box protein [Deltaproteobacteria bacterium]|nr:PAS domain S-box protein [Deltaproteobacteria bacterium]